MIDNVRLFIWLLFITIWVGGSAFMALIVTSEMGLL